MNSNAGPWVDQPAQQVRPYMVAHGRTAPRHAMELDTLLVATETAQPGAWPPEAARALALCSPQSRTVTEIAATIGQPILVTKVVLSDLIAAGALSIEPPAAQADPDTGRPSPQLLQALLEGLEAYDVAVA